MSPSPIKYIVVPSIKHFNFVMERFVGKVAVVTGASVGVGPAITQALVEKGLIVVGISRRIEKIEEQSKILGDKPGKLQPLRCDVTKEEDIVRSFKWVTDNLGPVHILINNAGWNRKTTLIDGSVEEWKRIFDINVMALCMCTREAVKIMKEHEISGHVIHMNSIFGHFVPQMQEPVLNVYPASKFAVTALAETLRRELKHCRSKIKVTSISPGLIATEPADNGNQNNVDVSGLKPEDISEAIVYVLSTGSRVQVTELTIRSINETF